MNVISIPNAEERILGFGPAQATTIIERIVYAAWALAGRDPEDGLYDYLDRGLVGEVYNGLFAAVASRLCFDLHRDVEAFYSTRVPGSTLVRDGVEGLAVSYNADKDMMKVKALGLSSSLERAELDVFLISVLLDVALRGVNVPKLAGSGGPGEATTVEAEYLVLTDVRPPSREMYHIDVEEYAPASARETEAPSLAFFDSFLDVEALIRAGDVRAAEEIESFPDEGLRLWLEVLAAYWNDDSAALEGEDVRRTSAALRAAPKPSRPRVPVFTRGSFRRYVDELYRSKEEDYRSSWRKHGEFISVLANIARKADRLGVAGGGSTAADTAIDFFVLLMFYRLWLTEVKGAPAPIENLEAPEAGEEHLADNAARLLAVINPVVSEVTDESLYEAYERLEELAEAGSELRHEYVDKLLPRAMARAFELWRAS